MFGSCQHVPARCRTLPPDRLCRVCGRGPRLGSALVCMDCHRVSADKAPLVAVHVVVEPRKPAAKFQPRGAKPKPKKLRLTKAEREALLRDALAAGVEVLALGATPTPDGIALARPVAVEVG